jgi:hypothetical protein
VLKRDVCKKRRKEEGRKRVGVNFRKGRRRHAVDGNSISDFTKLRPTAVAFFSIQIQAKNEKTFFFLSALSFSFTFT